MLLQVRIVVEAEIEPGKRVRLDAFTSVVNACGGLLEMGLQVSAGQELLLINPAADVQQPCKVVRVGRSQDGLFAVAFEFMKPAPQFWPIAFPPAD